MDTLAMVHLLLYPLLSGGLAVGYVWATVQRAPFFIEVVLFVMLTGIFTLTLIAHSNYQGYIA